MLSVPREACGPGKPRFTESPADELEKHRTGGSFSMEPRPVSLTVELKLPGDTACTWKRANPQSHGRTGTTSPASPAPVSGAHALGPHRPVRRDVSCGQTPRKQVGNAPACPLWRCVYANKRTGRVSTISGGVSKATPSSVQ